MPWLIFIRYTLLGLLLIFNTVALILSSSLFSISDGYALYSPIYIYFIFLSSFTILFLFPIALIDILRQGALSSRVLFELAWLTILWVMHLAGASALTAANVCSSTPSCSSSHNVLLGFAWLSVADILAHLGMLLLSAVIHLETHPDLWSKGVRDVPWFHPGSFSMSHGSLHHRRPSRALQHPAPPAAVQRTSWRSRFSATFGNDERAQPARMMYPFSPDEAIVNTAPPRSVPFTLERLASSRLTETRDQDATRSSSRDALPPIMPQQLMTNHPFRHPLQIISPDQRQSRSPDNGQLMYPSLQRPFDRSGENQVAVSKAPPDIDAFYGAHLHSTVHSMAPVSAAVPEIRRSGQGSAPSEQPLSPAQQYALEARARTRR